LLAFFDLPVILSFADEVKGFVSALDLVVLVRRLLVDAEDEVGLVLEEVSLVLELVGILAVDAVDDFVVELTVGDATVVDVFVVELTVEDATVVYVFVEDSVDVVVVDSVDVLVEILVDTVVNVVGDNEVGLVSFRVLGISHT
jgi:hypothetical protein